MNISIHVLTSIVLAAALYPFFGWMSALVIVGGVLVDADHYLFYILVKRDWSLKRAYRYYKSGAFIPDMPVLHISHTIEAVIVLLLFSLYYDFILLVLFGYLLHMLLDFVDTLYYGKWKNRTNSITLWLFKRIS